VNYDGRAPVAARRWVEPSEPPFGTAPKWVSLARPVPECRAAGPALQIPPCEIGRPFRILDERCVGGGDPRAGMPQRPIFRCGLALCFSRVRVRPQ